MIYITGDMHGEEERLYEKPLRKLKEGDTLSLGNHTLTFIMAPMVHWPEVMVSYESKSKVLFSADAFGKFGALSHNEEWACEARRYYFNICGKYGVQVQALLKLQMLSLQQAQFPSVPSPAPDPDFHFRRYPCDILPLFYVYPS